MRLQPSKSRLVGSSQLPMALDSFASLGRKPELLEIFVMASVVLFRWIPVDGLGQARGESDPKDSANLSDKEAETSLPPNRIAIAIVTMEK
jgi:hypothetical protein